MAMNVQSSLAAYGNYQNGYNPEKLKEKKEVQEAEKTAKENTISKGEKGLSKAAQEMLKNLRGSRSDMDFFVADFNNGDKAKDILSRSNKEFTVIFSNEELERMAVDEKYYAEKMNQIDGALRMSEDINAQFGFERAFGKDEGVEIAKFGISFNSDGTTTLFAELEKTSEKQRERIEKLQEKKAEAKKAADKKLPTSDTKRVTLQAATQEELLAQIKEIDWDMIKPDTKTIGGKMDFMV